MAANHKSKRRKPELKVLPGGKDMPQARFVDLTYDGLFKLFFVMDPTGEFLLLKYFLIDMIDFGHGVTVEKVVVIGNEAILEQLNLPPGTSPKRYIHDIKVLVHLRSKDGKLYVEKVLIEMQRWNASNFVDRTYLYGIICVAESQPKPGEGPDNFNTCHSIALCVRDVTRDHPDQLDDLTHKLTFNDGRGAVGLNSQLVKMQLVELGKCSEDFNKIPNRKVAWFYLFQYGPYLTEEGTTRLTGFGAPMELAVDQLKIISRDLKTREYEQALAKFEWDWNTHGKDNYDQGKKEGLEEGLKEGLEEGLKQATLSMLSHGMQPEAVSKILGLTLSEIDKVVAKS